MYKLKYSCYQESSVYSWLVCFLVFWLRNASLVKFGNLILDGIVFRFSPCLMRKRVEKSEAIQALLDSFQELHLEWKARVIIVFDVCFLYLI